MPLPLEERLFSARGDGSSWSRLSVNALPMSVYTDCSGTQGTSGAPLLSSIDGVWKIRAINVGGGGPDKDGMPYSFEAGSSEMAVNLDPEIVQQLAAFEAK
jgi:hypothetical protein